MGCCGSKSSGGGGGYVSNNIQHSKGKREQNWLATGQIILRDANLKELPSSISTVGSAAKVLDAKNNRLKALPPSLSSLEGLQRLNLANNLLERLAHFEALQNLKFLNLDSNQLSSLPPQLSSLQKLESLHCSRNILTHLPSSLGQLPRLKILICSSNKIDQLPCELQTASSLEEIDASDNYIQEVPAAFAELSNLKSLNLDKNQIRAIPPEVLKGCGQLQTLSLHSNPLTASAFEETDGFLEFERRRRSKVDKQMAGGATQNLEEGVDRRLAGS